MKREMSIPDSALPVVSLRQMILWADCPAKVFWERVNKRIRYDHDSLLRYLLMKTLESAYLRVKEGDTPDVQGFSARIWPWFLTQKGVPNSAELIDKMNRYSIMRRSIIQQTQRTNAQLTAAGFPPLMWWTTSQCGAEFVRARDEINQYQGMVGLLDMKYLERYPEQKRRPVTLADVYADFIDAVHCYVKSPISTYYSPEINPTVDLRLPSVSVRTSFDAVWYRPWTSDNPRRPKKIDQPETIVEYFIFGDDYSCLRLAVQALKMANDYRLPCVVDKKKGGLQPFYIGSGKNNQGREYVIDSVRYRYFFSDENSVAMREDTPSLSLEGLEHFANCFLKAKDENLFIPKSIIRDERCGTCVYQRDCYAPDNPSALLAGLSREQENVDSEFAADFSDQVILSSNPDEVLNIAKLAVSFMKRSPGGGCDTLLNVISNLQSDLAHERKEHRNA